MLKLHVNYQPYMNYNQQSQLTPKAAFRSAKIIHLALLVGQCLFAGVVMFLKRQTTVDLSKDTLFLAVAAVLSIGGFFASGFISKQVLATAANKETLADKMPIYQSALIIRYALLEAPSLFCIVSYFKTGNLIFLIISGVIILYFITLRPIIDKAAEELNLTYEEKTELGN